MTQTDGQHGVCVLPAAKLQMLKSEFVLLIFACFRANSNNEKEFHS